METSGSVTAQGVRRLLGSPFWPLFGREFGLGVPQCREIVGPELVRLKTSLVGQTEDKSIAGQRLYHDDNQWHFTIFSHSSKVPFFEI